MDESQVRSFNWFEFGKPVHMNIETEAPSRREDAGKPHFKVYIGDGSYVLICIRVDLSSLVSLCDDMQEAVAEINPKLVEHDALEFDCWLKCRRKPSPQPEPCSPEP